MTIEPTTASIFSIVEIIRFLFSKVPVYDNNVMPTVEPVNDDLLPLKRLFLDLWKGRLDLIETRKLLFIIKVEEHRWKVINRIMKRVDLMEKLYSYEHPNSYGLKRLARHALLYNFKGHPVRRNDHILNRKILGASVESWCEGVIQTAFLPCSVLISLSLFRLVAY